jgi:phospholipase/lecithinase/hemolysin
MFEEIAMNTTSPQRHALPWRLSALLAVVAASFVTACGGGTEPVVPPVQESAASAAAAQVASAGGDAVLAVTAARTTQSRPADPKRVRQVVVFGDSLSDVGTYRVGLVAQVGGGKYTTNPGPIWSETIALLFGTRLTPYLQGGFGVAPTTVGGTSFAMGGARVFDEPGYGCGRDPATGQCRAQLARSVAHQLNDYLAAHQQFTADQLVLVLAGPNDIFYHLDIVAGLNEEGLTETPQQALAATAKAAADLAQLVQTMAANGAKRIVVLNAPPMADTPFGKFLDTSDQTKPLRVLLRGMVDTFNAVLDQALPESGPVARLDLHAEVAKVLANPGAYLVREINVPACDAAKIATATGGFVTNGSSLFCSPNTLVQNLAPITYMFADQVHPTTLTHLIIARFVVVELWRRHMI